MGQQFSSECVCQEGGLFNMCTPEDPGKEAQGTLQPTPVPGYPTDVLSERNSCRSAGQGASMNLAMTQGVDGVGFASEEVAFVAAPPPNSGYSPKVRLQPLQEPTILSPVRREVTAEDILSDLVGAEENLYGGAFAMLPGGHDGFVGLDSVSMRDFVCTNSALSMADIDLELLKVAAAEEGLTRDVFLQLLREFSVSDGDAILHFMGLSNDGESLSSEECRSALLLFGQQELSTSFSEDRWERILNTVLQDAGVMVTMEQYLTYCRLTGRIVRLMRYAQIKKLAYGSRSKPGVRGGA